MSQKQSCVSRNSFIKMTVVFRSIGLLGLRIVRETKVRIPASGQILRLNQVNHKYCQANYNHESHRLLIFTYIQKRQDSIVSMFSILQKSLLHQQDRELQQNLLKHLYGSYTWVREFSDSTMQPVKAPPRLFKILNMVLSQFKAKKPQSEFSFLLKSARAPGFSSIFSLSN